MLYILLAGGVFNAVLVPQLVRSMRNDPDRGDAYTSRVVTVAGLFLVVVTCVLVVAAPLHRRPGRLGLRRRGARLRDRVHALLPAAGLLLRDVRPGRADPQRPRLVRPDDVGADRQQRHRGRRGAGLHRRLRRGRGRRGVRRLQLGPGAAARPRLDAGHRRAAADPGAVPAPLRLRLPAPARPARQRPGPHAAARDLDRALRGRQPDRLRRRPAAGHRAARRRRRTAPAPPSTPTASWS